MNDVITGVTLSNTLDREVASTWLGLRWIETVADSGVDKARRSLEEARRGGSASYRQILQCFPSGLELPIEYITVRLGDGAGLMLIGRNLRASSELQSRLIAAQQAMEQDYWKLREVQSRYRLLFDSASDPVLVLDADDLRVREANPAAIRALGLAKGWAFLNEMAYREREPFRAMLAGVGENGRTPGGVFHIGAQQAAWSLRAALLNDDAASVYLIQLAPADRPASAASPGAGEVQGVLHHMPDGFLVLDREGLIQFANRAFLDLVQAADETAVTGLSLDRWIRPPGADGAALLEEVRLTGRARLDSAIQGERGRLTQVEISAGADSDGRSGLVGVLLRETARIQPAANVPTPLLPRLASVGRTPLKALVQAAVEVVERHYVELALQFADGNRTAAAERLGLSRQSLYAKLNRYGLESEAD